MQKGFTLLELMVTLVVVAVILGFGLPGFQQLVQNNRMTSAANDLLAALNVARSEAVKRATPVSVCASNNPTAPLPACSGVPGMNGWVVFVDNADTDGNGVPDGNIIIEPGETILQTHPALDPTLTANSNGAYASFAATGFTRNVLAAGTPLGTALFCDVRGNITIGTDQLGNVLSAARVVIVAPTGRGQVLRTTTDVTNALAAGPPQTLIPGSCP
ncbi:MAG: GspH/FimT family pseudopilin [Gammaproteobacteria bacterium]|nr:GspH/FimT family pseudopilin [Gammaproteobacteria bacterium]